MIEYLTLIIAIPLGILLAKTTKDEKQIYIKYFKVIIPLLAISIIITIILSTVYRLPSTVYSTLIFTFITTLVWHKS